MSRKSVGSYAAIALLVGLAALLGYATGVRQAFWVAADNLVSTTAIVQDSNPKQFELLDSTIDANIAWLRKFDSFVSSSELDSLRPVFKKLALIRESKGDPTGREWNAIRDSPEWQELRRSNLEYLKRSSKGT